MSQKIINKRSSVITEDGKPKLPSSDTLDYGEIAINYADGVETLSIKNTSDEVVEFKSRDYVDDLVNKLITDTELKFFCIEPVTITINGESVTYETNSLVDIFLKKTDTLEISTTSENSILALYAWPGALDYYYSWLEGVKLFDGILFDMNSQDMYTKWNQGNQGLYGVQFAQYKNCVFWSDNDYISDVAIRTNYTLYNTAELPLCYSTIPSNTFKAFYFAYNVTCDPNWANPIYKESFANASWATQVFSYYGLHSIGLFDMDSSEFNIVLPNDCRGLMFYSPNILNAGVFDAVNTTNFGAKSGSWRDAFGYCYQLTNLYIKNLKVNINVSWSPINQQSLEFILTNAANTNTITIYLSPHTYYRLTETNKTLAAEKNIVLSLITSNTTDDNRLTMLQTDGDGNSFLANDGTYKTISSGGSSDGGSNNNSVGTVLYDVEVNNANYGEVTLSQSAANFERLDICACTDVHEDCFISIYKPNNSVFNLLSAIQEGSELIIKSRQYEITNNLITAVLDIGGMCSISTAGINTIGGEYIGIYKVIGYND